MLAVEDRVDALLLQWPQRPPPERIDDVVLNERRWKYAYVPLAALLLVCCLVVRGDNFRETVRYSLQGAALTIVFIAAIRFQHWAMFAWLNSRVAVFIGLLSYSLYLLHLAVLLGIARALPAAGLLVQGTLSLVISISLAWVIYVAVEKPCARLRRKLSD